MKIYLTAFLFCCFSVAGFAQVVVNPASGGNALCGPLPACTTLGTITITETLPGDFAAGTDQIKLIPPTGWQFCTSPAPTVNSAGGDVLAGSGPGIVFSSGFSSTALTISIVAGGTSQIDQITITGLTISPLTSSAGPGYINASSTSGVNGITLGSAGTDFGDLGLNPGIIASDPADFNICQGQVATLSDPTSGGTWTSDNTSVATIDPAGYVVSGVSPGTANIDYLLPGGCYATAKITVNANPAPIIGVHDMCQNQTYTISDATVTGLELYSSSGPIVNNPMNGTSLVSSWTVSPTIIRRPGGQPDTITYTLFPSGCSTTSTLVVNAIPGPIIDPSGTYQLCEGDMTTLTDGTTGGTWSSSNTNIATITPGPPGGDIYASPVNTGVTIISYTIASTGCAVDTPFRVNPVPTPITGGNAMCVGSFVVVSDATPGGVWTTSSSSIATVSPGTGSVDTVWGAGAGVATISYALNSGCNTTFSVTVNPIPDPISGSPSLCQGALTTFIETSSGGSWYSTNTAIATVDPSTGLVSAVTTGHTTADTVTIYYTYTTGCLSTFVLTVNPLPDPISPTGGFLQTCQGQPDTLTDATPGGTWTSSIPSFATVTTVGAAGDTGVVTGLVSGTVSITYTIVSTGCFVSTLVNTTPLDTITGSATVCEGQTIQLSDPTSGGGTWSSSNNAAATVDINGVVTGVSYTGGAPAGISVITFTTPTGCMTTHTVTVKQGPSPGYQDSVCAGLSVNLGNAVTGGNWVSTNTTVATVGLPGLLDTVAVYGINTDTITHNVVILYTLPGGCSASYSVAVNPLPAPIIGITGVCQWSTTMLSDSTRGGFWSSSNTSVATVDSVSGSVYSPGAGGITITYTLPTGCIASTLYTVFPLDSTRGDTSVICAGDTIQLSNSTLGGPGTWVSGNTGIAVVGPTGIVTGVQPGGTTVINYVLFYSPPTTVCTSSYSVTVNPLPEPIIGPSSVCQNQFITLSDAYYASGGMWSISNTNATIGSSSGLVTGVTPGTDTVTFTITSTTCRFSTPIVINPLDTISGPDSVCVGSSITLSDATPGGGTWSSTNTLIDTVGSFTGIVTGVSAGTDSVVFTTNLGCVAPPKLIKVNPLPDAIIGAGIAICAGDSVHLSDATAGGGTWSVTVSPTIATIDVNTGVFYGVSQGTVTITFTSTLTGCTATDTIHINPLPAQITGSGLFPNVCIYGTITLSDATGGGTWSSSDTSILAINDTSGFAAGDTVGYAIVTYTLPTGCITTDTIFVRPLPVISISHSPDGIICKGASTLLTAHGAEPITGPAGYVWAPPTGLSSTVGNPVTASPLVTTTYTVTGTTQYGCSDTGTTIVWVDSALNHLAISGRDSICAGASDTLHVTGGVDSIYIWRPPYGLNATNDSVVIATITMTTTYNAIAVDFMGCVDSAQFTVTVNPLPVLTVTPNPVIVCKRSTTTVMADGAGPGGIYTWSPNVFLSCDTCQTTVMSDTSNTVYTVTGTTMFGCRDSISIKVSVLDTNVNSISDDTIICIGQTVPLHAYSNSLVGNESEPTFLWTPATGLSDPYSNVPIATPGVTTVYTVVITENVCFKDTLHVQITVEPLPEIIITPPSASVIAGTAVQLLATAPNVVVSTYAWAPGNTLSCDTCNNPIATPSVTTTYTVTAVSNFGCIADTTVTINLSCDNSQIFIPNTFTPNGDGKNDRFYISGKGISLITRFAIYNRWGQLIYEAHNINANDPGAGWDGTYKGQVLEPDVFIYEVEAQCELGGQPFTYKGDISIVR